MADEMKKYLDHSGLTTYDEKIKKVISDGDAEALQNAKDYADGLADNYDVAGAATTAESNAKAYAKEYTDSLANGQVKTNTEAIAKLNGDEKTEGSVAKAVADAKADVEAKVDTNTGDITTMKGQIAALEAGTYDDTEVRGLIQGNTDAIGATDGKVNTLIGEDAGKSVRAITLEEVAKILNDNDSSDVDTLEEIAAWIAAHPDSVAELNAKISVNETAINNLKALVGTLPEGETSTTIVAYIEKLTSALSERVTTIEGNMGSGKVDDRIATAKQEAISASATDATNKANTAESNAKSYVDGKIAEFTPITTAEIEALFA